MQSANFLWSIYVMAGKTGTAHKKNIFEINENLAK